MSQFMSRLFFTLLSIYLSIASPNSVFAQNSPSSGESASRSAAIKLSSKDGGVPGAPKPANRPDGDVLAGLSLEEALNSVSSLPEIESLEDRIIEARERAKAQTTHPRPSLSVERQLLNSRVNAPGFTQDDLKIEQRLPDRCRFSARRLVGEAEVRLSQGEKSFAVFQKRCEIRKAFIRAFEAQEVLKTALLGIDRLKEAQRIVSTRSSAGHSSEYDNIRVELALAQEEDLPRQIQLEISRALSGLAVALSRPLPPQTVLVGSYPLQPEFLQGGQFRAMIENSLWEAGYTASECAFTIHHPAVALSDLQQALAKGEERAARAGNRPEWLLGTGYVRYHQDSVKVQDGFSLFLGVDLPVTRRARHEAEAARARRSRSEKEKTALIAQKKAEINGAIATLFAAQARLAALHQEQEEKAARLVHMMQISQQAGLHSILELVDAHRVERDLNLAKTRALMAVYLAFEEVHQALGLES